MRRFTTDFAYLNQQLGDGMSRRMVMRSLTGTAAAALLTALGASGAPAVAAVGAEKKKKKKRCKRVQQVCTTNRQCCNGRRCLNNGCAGTTVCCSPSGGRCAVDCDCCGSSICNFLTGTCL